MKTVMQGVSRSENKIYPKHKNLFANLSFGRAAEDFIDFPHVSSRLHHAAGAIRDVKETHVELNGLNRLERMIEESVIAQLLGVSAA